MANTDWSWEGNISRVVMRHLESRGWVIESVADTTARQPGPDIRARKAEQLMVVEVKGYPSTVYQRGPNKGKPKPTNPPTQARHWFAEALFTALLRRADHPAHKVAMAFPEFAVYANLLRRLHQDLVLLGLTVFLVRKSGEVVVSIAEQGLASHL